MRSNFIDTIKERLKDFKLTNETIGLRKPIHAVCVIVIILSSAASIYYGKEFLGLLATDTPDLKSFIVWQVGLKQVAFTAIAVSTVIFYLKWMNSWFEKNAQAEFQLKQLHLDFERANWIVETAFEWRQVHQDSKIPNELLSSLSNNLFSPPTEDDSQPLHPSDQVIRALVGNADRIEFTGKGIKRADKQVG